MISGSTRLAGLIGHPARYSLSPQLHNAAYRAMGLDISYLVLPVTPAKLRAAILGLSSVEVLGMSVTVPHKQSVIECLDSLDPIARRLTAVNCISFEDGRTVGYNTDGDGFVRSLREVGFDPADKRCVVVGAGGAARAVVDALGRAGGADVAVLARNQDRAGSAAALHGNARVGSLDDVTGADLFVNATPLGMSGESVDYLPPGSDRIEPGVVVADLVYSPLRTRLLQLAAKRSCETVDGTGMLLHQAAEQIRIWTGQEPPVQAMRLALSEALTS